MADNSEELEPLFDYRRVQPHNFVYVDDDDGSDTSPYNSPKRRKTSKNPKSVKKVDDVNDDEVQVIGISNDVEEDWLPPPPKVLNDNRLGEDSTIKELRLKKQELESLAKSGVDVLRAMEESVKRELSSSVTVNDASETVTEQPAKPPCERAKIVISVQDKEETKQFRVYKDDKFERLFKLYADKIKLNIHSLVFSFDGDKISPRATPDSLGMEDDDIIEVHVKKS